MLILLHIRSEELPYNLARVKVFIGPGMYAAVNLVYNHIHARWSTGIYIAGYHTVWIHFRSYRIGGQFRTSVVIGYRSHCQGHGNVCAPSSGILMVALPHRSLVGIAMYFKERHRNSKLIVKICTFKGKSNHRCISAKQFRISIRELIA